jgi:hypothetical protein
VREPGLVFGITWSRPSSIPDRRNEKEKSTMKASARALAVSACALVLSAGTGNATQKEASNGAERTVFEALYDQSDSFYVFPCSEDGEVIPEDEGELIDIEGQIYERVVFLIDGTGEYHYQMRILPVGLRGVGVISGEEFRITEADQRVGTQRLAGGTGSYRGHLKMIGAETRRTFWMTYGGHYNIAPDGTVKVTREDLRAECRAGRD